MRIVLDSLFLQLLQVAIGKRDCLSSNPTDEQWRHLFVLAQEQTVVGICLPALEVLYNNKQTPPQDLTLEWVGVAEQIKVRNKLLNIRASEICSLFREEGFRSCILKGQGNARLYPNPFSRSSGDIDIWLEGEKKTIRSFVKQKFPEASECYWHIDYPIFKDVPIEVHFMPSYARSPKYNKRLQQYYSSHTEEQFSNKVMLIGADDYVCVPTFEFNIVQQISHVMRHFFIEGIGMRHIMDIYYLLSSKKNSYNKKHIEYLLRYLGLYRFTTAIMWILYEVLRADDSVLIADINKHRGKLLLDEILRCGNWGRYDKRAIKKLGKLHSLLPFVIRNLRFIWLFPYESIITPIARRICRDKEE